MYIKYILYDQNSYISSTIIDIVVVQEEEEVYSNEMK